ncbi:MAG: acyl-CoA dehydrogenase [Pseudomonadota bacterium]
MDFTHTEDRRMLADSLRRYFAEQYTIEERNAVAYETPYHNPAKWQELVELGIPAALVTETAGGFGGSGFDICIVFEELGRALCPEPLLSTLMSSNVLTSIKASDLLNKIVNQGHQVALAVFEPDNPDTLSHVNTTATQNGDVWQLNGHKSVIYGGASATEILVAARTESGIGLFCVSASHSHGYATIDGGGAADLVLVDTEATCLSEACEESIEEALNAGRLALCAEAVGAMDVLHEMTVEYLKQRQQFGTIIATFQALQHRLVDMAVEIEQARSITTLAASKLGTDESSQYVSKAKNLIGRAATLVAEEATQLHGGIGMTWEYAGSHYTKRLIMIDHQLGDRFVHINRLLDESAA